MSMDISWSVVTGFVSLQSTNFTTASLFFFEREIKRNGLYDDLQARGITKDTVVLAGSEFEWVF